MGLFLLLLFIAVPVAEIAVFIQAGSHFGLWPTIMAIIGTALLGAALLRWQGLATLARAQQSLQRNELPVAEIYTGLCLLAAGALLLTPGFITDTVGFLLFAPPFRHLLGSLLRRVLESRGTVWMDGQKTGPRRGQNGDGGPIIDGEFHEFDPTRGQFPAPDSPNRPANDPKDSPWRGPEQPGRSREQQKREQDANQPNDPDDRPDDKPEDRRKP
ncbi:MAG: FxsA family protein [Alphaproteobacteria bacterium]|jgi:UPF0716 protein FxsA